MIDEGLEIIRSGLIRKSANKCSIWTSLYRITEHGPWNFDRCPWVKDLHDRKFDILVCKKGAQLGFTELAINKTLHIMDINKVSCLYLLPAERPDAKDFSTARLDTVIELSPHLRALFSDIKNTGYKRAGSVSLYIRGARSRSGLKSIPVGFIVFDEYDEMDPEKIPLAMERMSGQVNKSALILSTPTIPEYGISALFEEGTKEYFMFPCPRCDKLIDIKESNLVVCGNHQNDPEVEQSHLICLECKGILDHESKIEYLSKGKWIATAQSGVQSVSINQGYSLTVTPTELAKSAHRAKLRPEWAVEYYNSKWGETYVPDGAKIGLEHIHKCMHPYSLNDISTSKRVRTMGVDVGKLLHIEIVEWIIDGRMSKEINTMAKPKVIGIKTVESFEMIPRLIREYQVHGTVIDANPERRKVQELIDEFPGSIYMCFYRDNASPYSYSTTDVSCSVDRTSWMDQALGRFINNSIIIPQDVPQDYKDHLQVPTRMLLQDRHGNPVARYISKENGDHFAHARVYSELALPLAASITSNSNIRNFL